MEDLLLGQARGLLILAKAAQLRNDTRVYFSYLLRAKTLLDRVTELRGYSYASDKRAA